MLYLFGNGPAPIGTPFAGTATGATTKVLLQVRIGTPIAVKIVEWGVSFDGQTTGTPIKVELIEVDAGASVTSAAALDVVKWDDPNQPASTVTLGGTATGYWAVLNGTPTTSRIFGAHLIAPTNQFVQQYPLGREPMGNVSKFVQIRVTAAVSVNAYAYIIWEE